MDQISISPNTPAGEPPPGVVSNFVNPPSQEGAIVALEAVFLTLMMLAVAVRMWVRLGPGHQRHWRVDDTTCVLAAIGSIVHMIIYTQSFRLGFGRHLWDIRAQTLLDPSSSRVLSANSIVYPWVICFAKVSILLLYIRLFWVEQTIVIAAWLGIVIDSMFYTAFAGLGIGGIVKCASLTELDSSYCKFNEDGMVMFTSVVNVVTDFYVLLLPAYPVSQLKLNPQKWIGLACVFGSGLAACATSLARLINFAIHQHSSDTLWVQGVNAKYTVVEMNMAIIVGCVSCFPPFFNQIRRMGSSIYESLTSRLRTRHGQTGRDSSGSSGLANSYNLDENPSRKTQESIQEQHIVEPGTKPQSCDRAYPGSESNLHDHPVSPVSSL